MRPKFRGRYESEKLMLPIAEITYHKNGDILAFPLSREAISSYLVGGNVVLMQFTGLFDKNGKEIYEGDIIKYSGNSRYWTVYWNEVVGQFRFKCYGFVSKSYGDYAFHSALEYRIVGNIHENPELINR